MPKAAPAPVPVKVNPELAKQEGVALITPLQSDVEELQVTTEEEYLSADSLLHRIKQARKTWESKMEPIIRPIRQGLDNLYALNREIDKPLETLESDVKAKMKYYKVAELRRLQAAEDERKREEDRLRREAEEKATAAARAATPQLRGRLQAQATRAEQQAEVVSQQEMARPVQAASSVTRPVKKARIKNMIHFLQGIVDGYVPEDAVQVNMSALHTYFKDDPEGMKAWPGVEIYDDVQIVGR